MRFWRSSWRSMLELSKCWKEKAAKAMTVRQCSHTIACLTKCGHLGARQSKPLEGLEGTQKFSNSFFFYIALQLFLRFCRLLACVWWMTWHPSVGCCHMFEQPVSIISVFFCNLVGISIISTSFHQQLASDEHCKIFPCSKFSVVARLSYAK